jgi:hypothetical protein
MPFDIKETATNAVTTVANKLSNSSLAKDISANIPQSIGQLQAAAGKLAGQVSNTLRDPFGAINIDISASLKAQSVRTATTKVDVAPPYPNILNIFASYTYIFTLSALSDDEINFPDSTYRSKGPRIIICKSANGDPYNRVQTEYGQFDFFIDNFNLTSLIAWDKKTQNTSMMEASFTVTEPFSMGMFMQSIAIAAERAGHGGFNEAPFLLTIEFKGFTEQNETVDLPELKKYIPITLRSIDMNVTGKGTTYKIVANPWNDKSHSDRYTKFKTDVSVMGKTVQEVLQTGENSLQKVLNDFQRLQVKDGTINVADQIVILFPTDIASSASGSNSSSSQKENSNPATSNPSATTNSSSIFEKLGVVESTIGSVTNLVQDPNNCNAIGKSSMGYSTVKKGDTPYAKEGRTYDEKTNTWTSTPPDISLGSLQFKQGSDVITCINQVILQSDYARQALKKEQITDEGMLPQWRVDTELYQIPSEENYAKTGTKPRLVVYRVVPYLVHASKFMPPNTPAPGLDNLKKQAIKEYNYIYTGKNLDVLDFDITVNNIFYTKFSATNNSKSQDVKEQASNSSADGADVESPPLQGQKNPISGSVGTKVLPVGTITSSDKQGGGGAETVETRVARQFFEAVTESADVIELDLKILGDPYYLGDSGLGNYSSANTTGLMNMTDTGSIDYQTSECYIIVNFRTPIDINQSTGMYDFGDSKILMNYSGLFKVREITSTFSGGKFLQSLHLIRIGMQEAAEKNKADYATKFPGAEVQADPEETDSPPPGPATNAASLRAKINAGGTETGTTTVDNSTNRAYQGVPGGDRGTRGGA